MRLQINGDALEVPDHVATVTELLEHFQLGNKMLVVELDGVILDRNVHGDTRLPAGSKIEIVHFVGGG
ncbi:sulfur carrier protein ThiS [Paenibacillus athensensis]|uniref:Thiamine biosynthesis protein ThiS n=1 Tax=Paenibacillus athensensis TaxID=1967502 RepID=A0A4Y8PQE4_9BACL|nr:sulfur carrier protein ThiS [Paenibacillus athensensis]MCD1260526.1 sulfur carrier protein ThiS [Paenibacillus athensensis]